MYYLLITNVISRFRETAHKEEFRMEGKSYYHMEEAEEMNDFFRCLGSQEFEEYFENEMGEDLYEYLEDSFSE